MKRLRYDRKRYDAKRRNRTGPRCQTTDQARQLTWVGPGIGLRHHKEKWRRYWTRSWNRIRSGEVGTFVGMRVYEPKRGGFA